MIKMESELEETVPEKQTSLNARIEKLESILRNEITPEIMEIVR